MIIQLVTCDFYFSPRPWGAVRPFTPVVLIAHTTVRVIGQLHGLTFPDFNLQRSTLAGEARLIIIPSISSKSMINHKDCEACSRCELGIDGSRPRDGLCTLRRHVCVCSCCPSTTPFVARCTSSPDANASQMPASAPFNNCQHTPCDTLFGTMCRRTLPCCL